MIIRFIGYKYSDEQHAKINQMLQLLQYDWCSWIPNAPPTMRMPPPTKKGQVDLAFIVNSLPDRGRSCWHLGAVWALSQFQDNEVGKKNPKNKQKTRFLYSVESTHSLVY